MKVVMGYIDKNRGLATFVAGLIVSSMAWFWWVAGGGIAPFIHSAKALNDSEISAALVSLPDRLSALEAEAVASRSRQADLTVLLEQVRDTLDAFRAESERIVEWAPTVSQRLTDEAGGCYAGEECTVYFRGRRTVQGQDCKIVRGQPFLYVGDSEYPVAFAPGYQMTRLTHHFQTVPATISVPSFIPEGRAGLVVITYYVECPFAPNQTVERSTFRLNVDILPARELGE